MSEISLKTYCDNEGVSVEDVLSKSRDPEISKARKNVARAMAAENGLDYKLIAVKLKISPSAVWTYLNTVSGKRSVKNCLVLDFSSHEETYQTICDIAKQRLRTPENQPIWWIVNCDFDKLQKGLAGE